MGRTSLPLRCRARLYSRVTPHLIVDVVVVTLVQAPLPTAAHAFNQRSAAVHTGSSRVLVTGDERAGCSR